MSTIHERATITSKGQITLPKAIRQALGVDAGGSVAFDLQNDGQIVVTRADATHADPAIGAFLTLMEKDIQAGRNVRTLPAALSRAMLQQAALAAQPDGDIEGDVEL